MVDEWYDLYYEIGKVSDMRDVIIKRLYDKHYDKHRNSATVVTDDGVCVIYPRVGGSGYVIQYDSITTHIKKDERQFNIDAFLTELSKDEWHEMELLSDKMLSLSKKYNNLGYSLKRYILDNVPDIRFGIIHKLEIDGRYIYFSKYNEMDGDVEGNINLHMNTNEYAL